MPTRILVVEDEILPAMELVDILIKAGHQVIGPAGSVAEALSLVRTPHPDAAVLDVNLRGERVTAVARHLRAIGVPFVFASAYTQQSIDLDPGLAGALNVGKPIIAERLLHHIQRLIDPAT